MADSTDNKYFKEWIEDQKERFVTFCLQWKYAEDDETIALRWLSNHCESHLVDYFVMNYGLSYVILRLTK